MTIAALPPTALSTVQVFGEPQLHTDGELLALTFAPDGTLWSVEEPGILRHWHARTGQQLQWHSLSDLETLWCFTNDTRVLISASDDLSFWDTSSGLVLTAVPQPSWVTAVAAHPDPERVATGHDDGSIRFWDAWGHQLIHHLTPSSPQPRRAVGQAASGPAEGEGRLRGAISALAISPNGTLLAAAHEDRVITLWDLKLGKQLGTLDGHTDRIPVLCWHPGGEFLVSAGWDTTARVWHVRTRQPVILLNTHAGQVTALAFSPDGGLLACADSALTVHVWDFATKKEVRVLKGPQAEVRCLAFSPDGKTIASSGDHLIHLWDVPTGQASADSQPRQVSKTALALNPDGSRLANNGGGLAPRIWNVETGQSDLPLEETHPVHGLAWSPTGAILAGACGQHVRFWDAASGKIKLDLDGPVDPITCVVFSQDGSLLASAGERGLAAWLWRVSDGEPILLIPDALDGCAIQTLAFHPARPLLAVGGIDWMATGGSNGAVSLWDYQQREVVATFFEGTQSLAFHPSGDRLALASLEDSICIWDVNNKELLVELTGHDGPVTCLAYSPDGQWLATAGEDRTVRLWDEEGDEQACHELDSQPTALAFSPDGRFLYTANANTTCYQLKLADLLPTQEEKK